MKNILMWTYTSAWLLVTSTAFAQESRTVLCEDSEQVYKLTLEESGKSGFLHGILYYAPPTLKINFENYKVTSAVVDDKLKCFLASESPVVLKCQSTRDYQVTVPRSGISEKRILTATFEIAYNKTETTTVEGVRSMDYSIMSYKVNDLDFTSQIPSTVTSAYNIQKNKSESLYFDFRTVTGFLKCSFN